MYEIMLGNEVCGTAKVTQEGLYYHFSCMCELSGDIIYKVVVECGERKIDLGVCIPKGNKFVISKYIPMKHVGEGNFMFRLLPRRTKKTENFVPIRAEEPFAYLNKIETAFLEIVNDQIGAVLSES